MLSGDAHSQSSLPLSGNKREKRLIYSIPRNEVIAVCESLAPMRRIRGGGKGSHCEIVQFSV